VLFRLVSTEESTYLAPEGDIYSWLSWLEQRRYLSDTQLALVGHQPDLGQWAEIFVWGSERKICIEKPVSLVAAAETGSPLGHSQLFWLTPPKYLL